MQPVHGQPSILAPSPKLFKQLRNAKDFKACTHLQRPCAENIVTWIRDCRGAHDDGLCPLLIMTRVLDCSWASFPPKAEGIGGRRGMWRSYTSAPWVYVLKGGSEILGDHSYLSKQKLSCQDRKCCYLGFIKFSLAVLGFADIAFITGNISSFGAASTLPLPSPASCLPDIEDSVPEDFYASICSPSHPAEVASGRWSSILQWNTPQGTQDLQSPVHSRTALTLGGTLRSELESLFQENVTHQGYKD